MRLVLVPRTFDEEESRSSIASTIYGLVTVLAVIEVLRHHPPSAIASAVTLFGATVAVALVDVYSEWIASIMTHRRSLYSGEIRLIVREASTVIIGAQGPTVVLLLSVFGLMSVPTALVVARIVALLSLFAIGFRVGQLLHGGRLRQVMSGLALLAIGALIVLVKAAFH